MTCLLAGQTGTSDSMSVAALAAAADAAAAARAEGFAASLAHAEANARHLAAERDELQRRLDAALAAQQRWPLLCQSRSDPALSYWRHEPSQQSSAACKSCM